MGLKEKLQRAAVEVERAEQLLIQAERYYDALFRQVSSGSKAQKSWPNEKVSNSGSKTQMRLVKKPRVKFTDRLEALILSEPNKEWSYTEIFKTLPDIPTETVRSLLFRLKKAGKVTQAKRGKWKAV